MKKILMILPLTLILCLSASSQVKEADTSKEDLDKELIATVKGHFNAWNERDWDTYFENGEDAIGFGRWSAPPRDKFPKAAKIFASKYFLNSMEISEYVMEEEPIVYVVDNTGIVLGKIVEKAKPKNGELKSYDVRYSFTFVRSEGKWKRILYHLMFSFPNRLKFYRFGRDCEKATYDYSFGSDSMLYGRLPGQGSNGRA